MHLIFSSLLLAFHLLLVVAQDPDCQTKFAGILSAQVGGNLKSFTPATSIVNDSVAYVGNGKSPYVVQFQKCASLNVGEPAESPYSTGRLFVPAKGRCIAMSNQSAAAPPYFTTVVPCGTTPAERFTEKNGEIYWIGRATSDGTIFQGGCNLLGYAANASGPIHTGANNTIWLTCDSKTKITTTPFKLSLLAK